jgi:tetratricopeptide (TPR) repeat protein
VWPAGTPPAVVRRATVLAPVVVVRPLVGEPADPLTVALAGDLAQALGTSPEVRVTSSHAVDTLNRPGEPSAAIMGALQADVLVEILPVARRADGLHANVRLLVADAALVTLPPQGPAADPAALLDQVLAALGPRLRVDTANLRPVSARAQLGATSPDALQRYRRGALLLGQGASEVLADAAVELRAAMELDPEFAQAYALWAQGLMRRYRAGQVTAADAFDLTRTAIAQALARDPENSDAFAVAADLYAEDARDWARAESEFQRALSLSPSNEYARTRYAMLLSARGRTTEAVEQREEARRLAPLSSTLQGYLGMTLHYAGRDEEALRLFEQLHAVDRGWGAALVGLCRVYTSVGQYAEAMTACAEVERRQTEQQPFVAAQRAAILAGQGRTRDAEAVTADLAARFHAAPPGERADLAFFTAVAQVALRQFDEAFAWLELATEERSSRLLYVRIDPRFTALRSDPRFASVVARVDQRL